uniref:Ribosomal protein S14 n=1 Tax=Prototheca zopfii TaxID=3112 RepID=A0A2P1G7Y7_9CHLO|nr:ribosomal protein S14 [Prototheca bovis]AVM80986.1 ribosomal protein S14 [Prototheca bovis]
MTRKCLIMRQQKRLKLVNKFIDERVNLKHLLNLELSMLDKCLIKRNKKDNDKKIKNLLNYISLLIIIIYQKTLFNKHSKNSMIVRLKNRCYITGRSRGFVKKWGVSRIIFRDLAAKGLLPGIIKSSW